MNDQAQASANNRAVTVAVLLGASLMLTMSMGMRQSFGLFVRPITADVGVSVADFTFALAVQNIVWGLTQPLTGAIADRFGCRAVTISGSFLFAAGLAVTMIATGPIALLIGMGLMIGLAMSCVSLSLALAASAKVVSPAKRSLTLGTVSALGSIGAFIAAPLAQHLLVAYGWKAAIVGFLGLCVIMLPGAFFIGAGDKIAPRQQIGSTDAGLSLKGALAEAARHRGYITMAVAFFVCGLQLVFLTTHLPAYLALCGQSPALSATALAVIGGFNAIGCYLLGWLGGRLPKQHLLGGVYILRSLIIIAYFMSWPTPASTVIFSAAMGLLWLGTAPLVSGLIGHIFGLRYMATLSGVAFFSHQLGSFVGAWGGGLLFDAMGSYDLAWKIGVAIGLMAGIGQMFMDARPTARMAAAPAPA
ncbi:MAG: MFS transporter [Betaproteobacteria bacterium RIFCSPLOWO2_02_FULL_63_19]|nr:MAG: MFS transporter [Betaproteobacteria bacterium RIFCSPLOWO2_02_FULL_63_19]